MITIYAEYLFIENFLISAIILLLTCRIYGVVLSGKVLFISSAACALYSFVFFIPNMGWLYSGISKLLFSAVLIKLTFFRLKIKQLLRVFIIFYIVSFILAGVVLGLIYFTKLDGMVGNDIFYIGNISYLQIFSFVAAGYFLVSIFAEFLKSRMLREKTMADLRIEIGNASTTLRGLLDTGNFLKDPVSKSPVFIVEWNSVKSILPDDFNDFFVKNSRIPNISDGIYMTGLAEKIRMIPYKALGTDHGMLIGIKTNKVIVTKKNESIIVNNAVVALYHGKLDKDGEYSALLHPDILNEGAISNV